MIVRAGTRLLDLVAEALVANPGASLAEVAEAAGVGRTTLHKHYATRDDLLRAVAHRALDLWDDAVSGVETDGDLAALVAAMVPIGPQLAFLWRTPSFDHDSGIGERWRVAERRGLAVVHRAVAAGVVRVGVPDKWLLATLYALVYSAAELVADGHLAPRDAPRLVVDTFLSGLGTTDSGLGPTDGGPR
jgi:AcrR family transcriptional regulator